MPTPPPLPPLTVHGISRFFSGSAETWFAVNRDGLSGASQILRAGSLAPGGMFVGLWAGTSCEGPCIRGSSAHMPRHHTMAAILTVLHTTSEQGSGCKQTVHVAVEKARVMHVPDHVHAQCWGQLTVKVVCNPMAYGCLGPMVLVPSHKIVATGGPSAPWICLLYVVCCASVCLPVPLFTHMGC